MIITGLANLLEMDRSRWQGQRIGLVTHAAAVLPDLSDAVEALWSAGLPITALFGPEHGLLGVAGAGSTVGHGRDPHTQLPIWSLYGATKQPTPEMLAPLDLLIVDLQDVGARFYTYLSTLWYVLHAAAKAGMPVWVLDRPNPISGLGVEGPLVAPGFESFVGILPVPIRHGLTIGEAARLIRASALPSLDLTVVNLRGWQRHYWLDQTGHPWVSPSPAMARLTTATLYPGMCLLEGTNLSLGRGTVHPFELCGAPWLDSRTLAAQLNALELPGVRFRPTQFMPVADRFAGEVCAGVQVHLLDRSLLRPVALGLHMIATIRRLAPNDFAWQMPHFDRLLGSDQTRLALDVATPVIDIVHSWDAQTQAFLSERRSYLLY